LELTKKSYIPHQYYFNNWELKL